MGQNALKSHLCELIFFASIFPNSEISPFSHVQHHDGKLLTPLLETKDDLRWDYTFFQAFKFEFRVDRKLCCILVNVRLHSFVIHFVLAHPPLVYAESRKTVKHIPFACERGYCGPQIALPIQHARIDDLSTVGDDANDNLDKVSIYRACREVEIAFGPFSSHPCPILYSSASSRDGRYSLRTSSSVISIILSCITNVLTHDTMQSPSE